MKPQFKLKNKDGKIVRLDDFKERWVVVYFYPRDLTPGCTLEANEFTKFLPDFKKLNCEVIGISPDSMTSHCKFYDKEKLKINLLSDPDKSIAKKFGAYGKKKLYGKEYEGIIRSTFLINKTGEIAHSWKNVKAPGHAEKVLEKLRNLKS
ncbi:thioredoxin-dependent thiol peroxidase [archaeon]|nr:thioredoxin-dependent thiol peroxidase [archaeon]PJC45370.1 MAG: thioredoxin-dependent thiol peroxidase [Candidatus Pacearchaeota archaeon CG_4_9_14_0_2_um_filter_30_8]